MKRMLFAACGLCVGAGIFAAPLFERSAGKDVTAEESAAAGFAEDEFRRGVHAYYRGEYNEAIRQFELALSYRPDENLIIDWLGKANYQAGIEGAALQQWQFAVDSDYGGLLLQNRIEVVRDRRITGSVYDTEARYTETGVFSGVNKGNLVFSQPVSVLPMPDGTAWVLAYSSNELLKFDVNGYVIDRIRGPLNGFDRPMDIISLRDGNLLVSEFAGDRLSLLGPDGNYIRSFGRKGRGVGEFAGPQFLAEDASGNVYVTDFGNARVCVFDKGGNGVFSFGKKTAQFGGLKAPTGIAVVGSTVYVADCVKGTIYMFDTSGNYLGILVNEKTFARPEAMKSWGRYLVVTDSNRIFSVDCETGSLFENARTGNAPSRLTCAVPDINGNVLATDFQTDEVYVMSKMTELVGGLFVQIERVNAENFPEVTLEVKVENRRRQPVVGLKDVNFFISEDKNPVLNQKLVGAASNNDVCDITILVDRSENARAYEEQVQTAVREIAAAMNTKGTLRIVSVGRIPLVEFSGSPEAARDFSPSSLKIPYSTGCSFDLGIRLAANDLINAERKRAIVFITAGDVSSESFSRYALADLTAYMNNNSISFAEISLVQGSQDGEEIDYLVQNTPGEKYYVYRPDGLAGVIADLLAVPTGLYQLSYTSQLSSEYGRSYLPVEVETYLQNRSGRDETGFFAPLE